MTATHHDQRTTPSSRPDLALPDEDDAAVDVDVDRRERASALGADTWVIVADPADRNVGPPAPARRREAR
ncbi:MAG: hypothetical protein OEY55_16170, partial [Acidimicrobiia bacterium]|nr:hypothetical protein [Acidimicrobiia bacterium]